MIYRVHVLSLLGLLAAGTALWLAGEALPSAPTLAAAEVVTWVEDVGPAVAGASLCRLLGLAIVAWLAVVTALDAVGVVVRSRSIRTLAGGALPEPLRILLQRGSVATLALVPMVAPADPTPPSGHAVPADEAAPADDPLGGVDGAATMRPLDRTDHVVTPEPAAAPPRATAPTAAPTPDLAAGHVVVSPGDSLWSLAEEALVDHLETPPSDAQVTRYWSRVVAANRAHLRSADPDVIYPGETVLLPPP